MVSRESVLELTRVLSYPKFRLAPDDRRELLTSYIPFCETIQRIERCTTLCRDGHDHMFLDLAQSGGADFLVSGDKDLLELVGRTRFVIETPAAFRVRVSVEDSGDETA